MPHKIFVAGEEALATDVNSYLMGQVVARFANASARTSALVSPSKNQCSALDTRTGLDAWNGSAWVDLTPFVQAWNQAVTTNVNGQVHVNFPTAFAANAQYVSFVQNWIANPPWCFLPVSGTVTHTGADILVINAAGSTAPNSTFGIFCLAVGARA